MSESIKPLTVSELASATRSARVMVTLPGVDCESRKALAFANALPASVESREALAFANALAGY
jgi:hypothetical protein